MCLKRHISILNNIINLRTTVMTIFLKNLLAKKNVTEFTPFWKLKLSESEFNELKDVIVNAFKSYSSFNSCKIEAALYYAEWWKRLKNVRDKKGRDSKEDVYNSLGIETNHSEEFFKAALKGLEAAGGELIHIKQDENLSSLFFQGGIPMNRIASESLIGSGWDRFIRGLILRNYDFDALQNQSARESKSLIAFCDQLKEADELDDKELMPFYCEDETGDKWYKFITEEIKKEKEKIQKEHPFNIKWEFEIDSVDPSDAKLNIYYSITGPQSLPSTFLEHVGAQDSYHDLSICIDSKKVHGDTYVDNFLYKKFFYRAQYTNGCYISVHINDNVESIESDYLDMNFPQVIHKDEKGILRLGNRIGASETYALFSVDWDIVNNSGHKLAHIVSYEGQKYQLWHLNKEFETEILFQHKITGESFILPLNSPLYRTGITYQKDELSDIFLEPIYIPHKAKVYKVSEIEDHNSQYKLLYREKHSTEWSDQISVGVIFVKPNIKEHISHIRVCYLGPKFKYKVIPGTESFKIKLEWPYGHVNLSQFGEKGQDNWWTITKEKCNGKNLIPCTFTPNDGSSRSFTLNLKTQFNEFSIYDINNNCISNYDTIPVSELNLYTYKINYSTQNKINSKITFFSTKEGQFKSYKLLHNPSKITIIDDMCEEWDLPLMGSVDKLIGGLSRVNTILGKRPYLGISISGPSDLTFKIQHNPFTIKVNYETNAVELDEKSSNGRRTYLGDIFAFALDEDSKQFDDIIILKPSSPGVYPLPANMPEKYIVCENNYTSTTGRIRVKMLSDHEIPFEERAALSNAAKELIIKELRGDKKGSNTFCSERWKRILHWFNLSYKFNIPADKLHDLSICASNDDFLVFLAFHVFALREYKEDEMIDRLLFMEESLSFKWWYINNDLFAVTYNKLNENFWDVFRNWAFGDALDSFNDNMMKDLFSLTEDSFYMNLKKYIDHLGNRFRVFMTKLAISSFCKDSTIDREMAKSLIKHSSELIASKCSTRKAYLNAIMNCITTIEIEKTSKKTEKKLVDIEIISAPTDNTINVGGQSHESTVEKCIKLTWDINKDPLIEHKPLGFILEIIYPDEPEYSLSNDMRGSIDQLYKYITKQPNNVFCKDIVDNISQSLSSSETCRQSIMQYYKKEQMLFVHYLQYLINR